MRSDRRALSNESTGPGAPDSRHRSVCSLFVLLLLAVFSPSILGAAGLCDATRVSEPTQDDDIHRTFVQLFREEKNLGNISDGSGARVGNVVSVLLKRNGEIRSVFFASSKAGGPVEYGIDPAVPQTSLSSEEIVGLFQNLDAIDLVERMNATFHSEGNVYRIIESHIAETVDFASQYDEVSMYSERIPCGSCEGVLNTMRKRIVELPGGAATQFRLSFDYNSQTAFKDLHTWNWDQAFADFQNP
jgi:hypothetical protein